MSNDDKTIYSTLLVQPNEQMKQGIKNYLAHLEKYHDLHGVSEPEMSEEEFQKLARDSKPAWDAVLQKMNEEDRKLRPITDEEYEAAYKMLPKN